MQNHAPTHPSLTASVVRRQALCKQVLAACSAISLLEGDSRMERQRQMERQAVRNKRKRQGEAGTETGRLRILIFYGTGERGEGRKEVLLVLLENIKMHAWVLMGDFQVSCIFFSCPCFPHKRPCLLFTSRLSSNLMTFLVFLFLFPYFLDFFSSFYHCQENIFSVLDVEALGFNRL